MIMLHALVRTPGGEPVGEHLEDGWHCLPALES